MTAGAVAAARGVFGQPAGTFTVWLHGMTILDITGSSMVIYMPAVPADGMAMKKNPKAPAKTPAKQMRHSAADYGHTYCLSSDSTLKTSVPLLSGDGSKADYHMMIKTSGTKPTPDEKSNFYLKRKSAGDLPIDPAQVVVTISIPFPKSMLPLRYAYHKDGTTPVMGGKTCDTQGEHPLKIPLLYGFVYDLPYGENPSLVRSDGTIMWQKPGADHVHVHAQPAGPDGSDHIQYLAGAFTPKAMFHIVRPPQIVSECAPADGALGTPAAELYGLPGPSAAACIGPSVAGNKVFDPDPGNCVLMFLDS